MKIINNLDTLTTMNQFTKIPFYRIVLSICTFLLIIKCIYCLEPDDPCYNQRYKQDGTCRTLSSCEKVLNDLIERDLSPQDCGYKGKEPIVCCPEKSGGTKEPLIKPRFRNSRDLCAEYAKSVFAFTYPSFSVGAPPKNTSLCSHVAAKLIFGGSPAGLAEFPHMALVGYGEKSNILWNCGGSLITDQWVLTAAHCAYTDYGDAKFVRLGELNYKNNSDGAEPQDFEVIDIQKHPDHATSHYNDIALLKLNQKAKFTKFVRPACLWTEQRVPTKKAIATGWGLVGFFGDKSSGLLKVTLTLKTKAECDPSFKNERRLDRGIDDSQQICAGAGVGEDKKDACQGDSGGPLQIYAEPDFYCMYYIVGVTSFGKPCGITRTPGVYTRVSNFVPWIEKIILPNE